MKSNLMRAALYIGILIGVLLLDGNISLPNSYFLDHDLLAGVLLVTSLVALAVWQPRLAGLQQVFDRAPRFSLVIVAAGLLAALLWLGTYAVMFDYPLTRDEHMVVFDAAIFSTGELAMRVPPQWSGYTLALVPAFNMETPGNVLFVSGYLPLNAAMRAGFGNLFDPALMNPVLTGIGFVALYDICKRLFPDDPVPVWIALGGYVLSAQILVNAMTTYAMTGHLALNLVWLALFLRDKHWAHGCALLVGFVAMGLHQFVFHPLFAGPIILTLLFRREWTKFALYAVFYAAALMFWIRWQAVVMDAFDVVPGAGGSGGLGDFLAERILPLVTTFQTDTLILMFYNLLRMLTWNAAFVLPLCLAVVPLWKQRNAIVIALTGGVLLSILAMMIILPYQGHGWGYRYLHGFLGSLLILAGFGYQQWRQLVGDAAGRAVAVMATVTAVILLPSAVYSAHRFVVPYAKLTEVVEAQDSDFVVVDNIRNVVAVDQVRNLPDLSNRPLIFSARDLTIEQVSTLCGRGSVAVIGGAEIAAVGLSSTPLNVSALPADLCGDPESAFIPLVEDEN